MAERPTVDFLWDSDEGILEIEYLDNCVEVKLDGAFGTKAFEDLFNDLGIDVRHIHDGEHLGISAGKLVREKRK